MVGRLKPLSLGRAPQNTSAGVDRGRCRARLKMLVLHDDAAREYAYGPAQGLPDTKVGAFTPALHDEAKKNGWSVSP